MKRLCAAFVAFAVAGLVPAAEATADTSSSTQAVSGLRLKAQELASQIQADGRQLDELDASYNAAQIQYQKLSAKQASLQKAISATAAEVAAARRQLKSEALLAYMTGGGPIVDFVSGRAGRDPSIMEGYADIIAGSQQRAEDQYRGALALQSRQADALASTVRSASITLADIKSDRAEATATLAAQRQALARTTGQLAVLVAQVEAAQQQAQEAAVKASLAARNDLPPASPPARPAAETTMPATTPLSHPPLSATTAAPSTAPPAADAVTTTTTTIASTTTTVPSATLTSNVGASGAQAAIAYAQAQLGKPYQWGGAGPDSFDCSGLVMMAWAQAGIYFPHLAQDQYDMTERISLSDLLPGDLVFFGTPTNVYHVGLYVGGGDMIDAPETGQDVSIQSIYWSDLLGAGRVQG